MIQRQQLVTLHLIGRNLRSSYNLNGDLSCLKTSLVDAKHPPKQPHIHSAQLDCYSPYSFGKEATISLSTMNAGGNSIYSEALSIQYFVDLGATDILLEKQVHYDYFNCKMVDFVMTFQGKRIGVSVARAMSYERNFTLEKARTLLQKKLLGLVLARNCVSKQHAFFISILHLQCEKDEAATILQQAYNDLILEAERNPSDAWNESLKGEFYVIITKVCNKSPFFDKVFARHKLPSGVC